MAHMAYITQSGAQNGAQNHPYCSLYCFLLFTSYCYQNIPIVFQKHPFYASRKFSKSPDFDENWYTDQIWYGDIKNIKFTLTPWLFTVILLRRYLGFFFTENLRRNQIRYGDYEWLAVTFIHVIYILLKKMCASLWGTWGTYMKSEAQSEAQSEAHGPNSMYFLYIRQLETNWMKHAW